MKRRNTKKGKVMSVKEQEAFLRKLDAKFEAETEAELQLLEEDNDHLEDDDDLDADDTPSKSPVAAAEREAERLDAEKWRVWNKLNDIRKEFAEKIPRGAILTPNHQKRLDDARRAADRANAAARKAREKARKLAVTEEIEKRDRGRTEAEMRKAFFRANPRATEADFKRVLPRLLDRQLVERTLRGDDPGANHPFFRRF